MSLTVVALVRYPVKGLSAEALDRVELAAGEGLPGDRRFALAIGGGALGIEAPWMPKRSFATLMRHEMLAALATCYEEATGTLVIRRGGREVVRGRVTTPMGRAVIEQFFAGYLGASVAARPKLVAAADGHAFADMVEPVVSILGLASVRDLRRVAGDDVDPLRFRANIHVDGGRPWQEFDLVGRSVAVGGARLEVVERIGRCAATTVRPGSGVRDLNIPRVLERGFGHADCGVYARVISGGTIAVGDAVVTDL